jgi:hypothetical protein
VHYELRALRYRPARKRSDCFLARGEKAWHLLSLIINEHVLAIVTVKVEPRHVGDLWRDNAVRFTRLPGLGGRVGQRGRR